MEMNGEQRIPATQQQTFCKGYSNVLEDALTKSR